MLILEDPFLYLPLDETVIWSLLDSVHILCQLCDKVWWLIHHTFAVSIFILEVWDSHLGAVYKRVNMKLPLSIWHLRICLLLFVFIRIAATHPFFFVSMFTISSLTMYVDSLLDDSSKYSRLQNSGARYINNKMLRRFQTFSVCLAICWQKETAEDLAETFAYYFSNSFRIPQHFTKG